MRKKRRFTWPREALQPVPVERSPIWDHPEVWALDENLHRKHHGFSNLEFLGASGFSFPSHASNELNIMDVHAWWYVITAWYSILYILYVYTLFLVSKDLIGVWSGLLDDSQQQWLLGFYLWVWRWCSMFCQLCRPEGNIREPWNPYCCWVAKLG